MSERKSPTNQTLTTVPLAQSRDEDGFCTSIDVLKSPPLDLIRIIEQYAEDSIVAKREGGTVYEKKLYMKISVSLQNLPLDL